MISGFDQLAKMSQFGSLWRSFTCGYLEHLLNVEYPHTNLPMVIHENPADGRSERALEKHYTFIGVVYWKKLPELAPGLFKNPLEADDQAFAEVHLFIPRDRLEWVQAGVRAAVRRRRRWAACPARSPMALVNPPAGNGGSGERQSALGWSARGRTENWNLLNQSWNCQLAPSRSRLWPRSCKPIPICPL